MISSRRLALAVAAGALALACAEELPGASPLVTAVEPAAGYAAQDLQIVIRGERFRPLPYQSGAGAPAVDATFRVWLGATELAGVEWVSEGELRARVPAGIPAGPHRLELRDPRGASAGLDGAYTAVAGAPPALSVTAEVAPSVASLGQPVTVRVDVTNGGDLAALAVTPAIAIHGTALALSGDAPPPQDVLPGETRTFYAEGTAAALGVADVTVGAAGTDAVTGLPVISPEVSAGSLLVQRPSALSASAVATPRRASVGQTVLVDVTYANAAGAAGVLALQPEVSAAVGGGAVSIVEEPPPCDLPADGTCVARFVLRAERAGTAVVHIDAAGTDANSGEPVASPRANVVLPIDEGPRVSAAAVASPERVNVGQPLTLVVTVTNGGDVAALGVEIAVLAAPLAAEADAAPPPQDVPPRETRTFTWPFAAREAGSGAFVVEARGADANGAGPVSSESAVSNEILVEQPAALATTFAPPPVSLTAGFAVVLEVTNPRVDPAIGQADALGVAAGALAVVHVEDPGFLLPSEVSCSAVDVGPADLPAGAAAAFRWTCSAARPGQVKLRAAVAGLDGNDPSAPPPTASAEAVYALEEAVEVAADPFADGTAFSWVFAYDGHVFLGPSGDGRGVVRCSPDGSGCTSFAFTFDRDVNPAGTVHRNACAAYVTIGSSAPAGSPASCDPADPEKRCNCGPDHEAGRGLLSSFEIAGEEWLVAMGRSASELRYLYMTRETASPLRWSYVDLTAALPGSTFGGEGVTSMAVLNDRLFVGLQADTGLRPRLLALERTPLAPGLDARAPEDATGVALKNTVLFETGPEISQLDAMLAFEGRLFAANRRGVVVSRSGAPDLTADPGTQFDDCTPMAPASWLAGSIEAEGRIDVTPADKAVPALVAWQGRMYLARNTRAGVPELWAFTPRRDGGAFLGCAANHSDWRLVATTFGEPSRTRATALFSSAAFLYYGLDDPTNGLALFRAASPAPAETDFTGREGCVATSPGCEPLGGAGFGIPTNTRFFDARALSFDAAGQVWATVGDGASGVRVYRIAEE